MVARYERRKHAFRTRFQFVDDFAQREGVRATSALTSPIRVHVIAYESNDQLRRIKPIELDLQQNSLGDYVWFGRELLRKGTGQRPLGKTPTKTVELREVDYELRVTSRDAIYAPAKFRRRGPNLQPIEEERSEGELIQVNGHPDQVKLFPGPNYVFGGLDPLATTTRETRHGEGPTLLRGVIRRTDGEGISGVRVETRIPMSDPKQPFDPPKEITFRSLPTDDSGQFLVVFAGRAWQGFVDKNGEALKKDEALMVDLTFEVGSSKSVVNGVRVVPGRQTSYAQTGLTGRVLDRRGLGMPEASITVSTDNDVQSRTVDDGYWSLYFPVDRYVYWHASNGDAESNNPLDVVITATTPDGQSRAITSQIQAGRTTKVEDIHFAPTS